MTEPNQICQINMTSDDNILASNRKPHSSQCKEACDPYFSLFKKYNNLVKFRMSQFYPGSVKPR